MPSGPITPALPDLETSARLLTRAVAHAPGVPLTLDLSDVHALTAGGLGQLVALHNRLRCSGGRLVLCNVGPAAYDALDATRLTGLFDVRRAG